MTPQKPEDLGTATLPEAAYAADFALLDKYQGFSTELLRLALLGVAVFGFLLEQFGVAWIPTGGRVLATAALVLLTLSAGFALAHRYLSSDGMFHHLRLLRLAQRAQTKVVEAMAEGDRARRGLQYRLSGYSLGLSALALLLGVIALVAFLVVLMMGAPELKPR